jgi:hypothetical protein
VLTGALPSSSPVAGFLDINSTMESPSLLFITVP